MFGAKISETPLLMGDPEWKTTDPDRGRSLDKRGMLCVDERMVPCNRGLSPLSSDFCLGSVASSHLTDVRQSQRPLSLTFLNGRCTILFKEVSSNHQKKSVTKFVTDFGVRFFSKKSVPKPEPKPKTQCGVAACDPKTQSRCRRKSQPLAKILAAGENLGRRREFRPPATISGNLLG